VRTFDFDELSTKLISAKLVPKIPRQKPLDRDQSRFTTLLDRPLTADWIVWAIQEGFSHDKFAEDFSSSSSGQIREALCTSVDGFTPIFNAIENNSQDLVRLLIPAECSSRSIWTWYARMRALWTRC
jgi:hypothetical protein